MKLEQEMAVGIAAMACLVVMLALAARVGVALGQMLFL